MFDILKINFLCQTYYNDLYKQLLMYKKMKLKTAVYLF